MDITRGLLIPEEKEKQCQQPWIPITPAKSMPTRPQTIPGETQGDHPGATKSFQDLLCQESFFTDFPTSAASFSSVVGVVDQKRDFNNVETVLGTKDRGDFRHDQAEWSKLPCRDLLALAEAASGASGASSSVTEGRRNDAASTTFVPGSSRSYYQTGSNLQQPESASLNQSLPTGSSMLNFNWPSHISHYGLPVPHRPVYDLNSLPSTSNMVYDVPVSFQFEPITPDHSKRAKIHQGSETVHACLDEQRYQENRQQKEVACCPETNVPELSCNMPGSTSVDFSSAALPSPMKDIHLAGKGEGHGIDLNTPPQSQKPKRRKHRPKVVIEGKPKRASKPRNPKQGSNTEKPTVKRKYVRKTAQKGADRTPVNSEKDTVNSTPESAARSSKRALNFDLEAQARDEKIKTRHLVEQQDFPHWGFSSNSERNGKDSCIGHNGDTLTKSMQQHTQGWEVIVENPTAQTAFDLNHYSTQKLDDSITCPETPSSESPEPTVKAHRKEYLKVQPKNTNVTSTVENGTTFVPKRTVAEGTTCIALPAKTAPRGIQTTPTSIAGECLNRAENGLLVTPKLVLAEGTACIALPANTVPSGVQSTSTSQQNNNCSTVAEVRGSKREHCSMMNTRQLSSTSLLGAQFNSLQVYHEIFNKIHKKKRTVKEHNTVASSTASSNRSAEPSERRAMPYGPSNFNATNVPSHTNNVQPSPPSNDTIITADTRSGFSNSERDLYARSMPAGRNSQVQNGYAQLSCVEMLNGGRYDISSELMLAYGHRGRATKMRSKVFTRARNLASLTAIVNCNQLQPARAKKEPVKSTRKQIEINRGPLACMQALAVDSHANMTKKKRTRKGVPQATSASYLCTNQPWLQNRWATSYQRPRLSTRSRGTSRAKKNYRVAVEELVHRFKCLSINTGGGIIKMHEQNAMVPFVRNGAMVPYEGPFDPKRRRPRPKVDLDPESDRVWKLLMGKECRLSIEGTKEENEKWWAEERRVFSLKVDAFIARMHLVLGDRRFTPWKGSVVDSCIGVFLTQNVSDHLSSSAFMSLSSKYPRKKADIIVEEPEISTPDLDVTLDSRDMRLFEQMCEEAYNMAQEDIQHIEETEVAECSSIGGCKSPDNSEGMQLRVCKRLENHMTGTRNSWLVDAESKSQLEDVVSSQNSVASSENSASSASCQKTENSATLTPNCTGLSEAKGKRLAEEVVSSQNSVFSSQSSELSILQTTEPIGSCSGSNSEAEDMISGCKSNNLDCSTTFKDLLQMSGSTMLQEYYTHGCGNISPENKPESVITRSESVITQSEWTGSRGSSMEDQDTLKVSIHSVAPPNFKLPTPGVPSTCSSNYHLQMSQEAGIKEFERLEVSNEKGKLSSLSTASGIADVVGVDCFSKQNCRAEEAASGSTDCELPSSAQVAASSTSQSKTVVHPLCISRDEVCLQIHSHSCKSFQAEMINNFEPESTPYVEINNHGEELAQMKGGMQQAGAGSSKFSKEILSVEETMHMTAEGQTTDKDKLANSSNTAFNRTTVKKLKANEKPVKENQPTFDWDSLRKEAYRKGTKRERNRDSMDTLDYEALRRAEVSEIAHAIKERGMNNMLAERIKDFLDRLVRDHGSIDLEWLKDVPPDKAKEFLLSIRGLGLKSVECVRLLTLHQLAFPVDTNVGRIAVRLGWVPLQPLPESLQLHLLELYPMQETIQKYLWPRLCTLDQKTLYELHYQMITFGKVFCTKSKPNCNACPLRADCRHFASAFASARLALPAPEEKGMVPSTFPIAADQHPDVDGRPMQITLPQTNDVAETGSPSGEPNNVLVAGSTLQEPKDVHDNRSILLSTNLISETGSKTNACDPIIEHPATPRSRTIECEPIIEEPASPETRSIDILDRDIEDAFYEDPDEIPTINLNIEQFTMNLQSYMQDNMGMEGYEMSKALVALTPEAAYIPVPKLKNVSRLRTEHEVYVLPDDHPLLAGMEKREPNDPGTYLLAIWTPGETPESTQPPERCCDSQESDNLCNKKTCFSCSSRLESDAQIVRGTLLIPCRTAMRGSFPLNGTYFQVNEVFADHASSISPIHVPRELIWKLPRRTVYFGTSVPSIFKGLSMEAIQSCFWRGYVCVRGFDQKTRAPRPLKARLHFTASRLKQEVKRAE